MADTCVVIGAGHAGSQLATSLRQEGWDGAIVLVGGEPHIPYHRPPLTKGYLKGPLALDDLAIRNAEAYARLGIELRLGATVERIDRAERQVVLQGGERLAYAKLALCTGARVRRLPVAQEGDERIHYLRTLDHLDRIRAAAETARRTVIVGGGYIGLEAAATLRGRGAAVTVLESAERVLGRVTAPEVSAFFERLHREEGVEIVTGAAVQAIEGAGSERVVLCKDGSRHAADFVIVGIGIAPETELAERCGLRVDNGIVVDEFAVTEDPDILAAGDCAIRPTELYGLRRLESVGNALEQAKTAAASICGRKRPDRSIPWFWSDQYDVKLQIAGLGAGHDRLVLRGDPSSGRSFTAFYLSGDRLIAADCVNRPLEFMASKRLIAQQRPADPELLGDESRALNDLLGRS